MKKSILFGCTALCAVALSINSVASTSIKEPSIEKVKSAFTALLEKQGLSIDKEILVEKQGNDFSILVPSFETQIVDLVPSNDIKTNDPNQVKEVKTITKTIPEKKLKLTRSGSFGKQAQYRIDELSLNEVKSIVKDFVPFIDLSAQKFNSEILWVPEYNMTTKHSLNIQDLDISTSGQFKFNADSLAFDLLAQPTEEGKMDMASSNDIKNITFKMIGLTARIPEIVQNIQWKNANITNDSIAQNLMAESISADINIPLISVSAEQDKNPLVSLGFSAHSKAEKNIHTEITLDNIVLSGGLSLFVPFTPTQVHVNFDIDGVDRNQLYKIATLSETEQTESESKVLEKEIEEMLQKATLRLNTFEAKNNDGSIAISGTIKAQLVKDELKEDVDAIITITNLDKISPEPTVNQAACDAIKKQIAEANIEPELAKEFTKNACSPVGGFLDGIRPMLNKTDRVVNPDGSTVDTIKIQYQNDILRINGKETQDLEATIKSAGVNI